MQKRVLNKLAAHWEQEILSSIIDWDVIAIVLFDEKGKLLFCNKALKEAFPELNFQNLINPTFEKIKSLPFIEENLVFNNQVTIGYYNKIDNFSFPASIFRKDDNIFLIGQKPPAKLLRQNQQLLALNRENSNLQRQVLKDKKKLEETLGSLDKAMQGLEKEIQTKDKFFSIIGHDLRSPFNSILGFSELLVETIDELDKDEIRSYAIQVNRSAQNSFELLNQLLEWGMLKQNKVPFAPEENNINKLVENVVDVLSATANRKDIAINVSIPDGVYFFLDSNMFSSIVRNLLSNAIKFTPPKGKIDISIKVEKDKLVVSLSDTGIGISEEKVNTIFNSEMVQSTYGTNQEIGTGLGLSLCREFIEMHKGHIWIESKLNIGTTIHFTIPS